MSRSGHTGVLTGLRVAAVASFVVLGGLLWIRYAQALEQIGTLTAAQRVSAATSQLLTGALGAQTPPRRLA